MTRSWRSVKIFRNRDGIIQLHMLLGLRLRRKKELPTETGDLRHHEERGVQRISTRYQRTAHRLEEKVLLDIGVFMELGPGFLTHQSIGTRTLK